MKKNKVGRPKLKNKIYKKRMISISDRDYDYIKELGAGNFSRGIRVILEYGNKGYVPYDIPENDPIKVDL